MSLTTKGFHVFQGKDHLVISWMPGNGADSKSFYIPSPSSVASLCLQTKYILCKAQGEERKARDSQYTPVTE